VPCVVAHAAPGGDPAPKFTIALETPPAQRWQPIMAAMKDGFLPFVQWLNKTIPEPIRRLLDPVVAKLDDYIDEPFATELRGVAEIAQKLGIGVDLGEILMLNLVYDISAGCTSIVGQDKDGNMLHARNLDYSLPGLRNITVQVDYTRNGKLVFTATHFAGYIGVLSGMRPNGWSVTVNERDRDATGGPIENIIEGLYRGGKSIGFFLRDALENNATYPDAMNTLQHTFLMAPVYLTVAGARRGEGAVITRERESPKDVWSLTVPTMWFVVQTNYDHWLPSGDKRAETAIRGMNGMNISTLTLEGMYQVISTPPVFNKGTEYSTLISPSTGRYETFVRNDAPHSVDGPMGKGVERFLEKVNKAFGLA